MKTSRTRLVAALLAAGCSSAFAAADFTTILATQTNIGDTTPGVVLSFTLPSNVNRSSLSTNSAVLDLEAGGTTLDYNEVYVNPPTTTCTSNTADTNQAASIGTLREHDDPNLGGSEWAANHFVFSSAMLVGGSNKLLICARDSVGVTGSGAGNIDDISLRGVVLHYHTGTTTPPPPPPPQPCNEPGALGIVKCPPPPCPGCQIP